MKKVVVLTVIFCAALISSCATMPRTAAIPVSNTPNIIYIVYRHWHTSIVLDAKQLAHYSPLLRASVSDKDFARIGWGDGDYFTGKSKSWGSASKALVASGYSALQVLTYSGEDLKDIPVDTIVPLAISDEGLQRLVNYIDASIASDGRGDPIHLPGIAQDNLDIGSFFQGKAHYHVFNNCNTWSAKVLQLAGLPVASRLTAQGVFQQAGEISRVQTQAGLFKRLARL